MKFIASPSFLCESSCINEGKEWYPETWTKDIWLDSDEVENLESLSHPEPPLPMEINFSPGSEETGFPLFGTSVTTLYGTDAVEGDDLFP